MNTDVDMARAQDLHARIMPTVGKLNMNMDTDTGEVNSNTRISEHECECQCNAELWGAYTN